MPMQIPSLDNICEVKLVLHLGDGQIECVGQCFYCVRECVGRDMFTNSAHMGEREWS